MKRIISCAVILSIAFFGTLTAQESAPAEAVPEAPTSVVDAENPGLGLLDQATEAKLRATTAADLGQVIVLCRRAKRAGLTGENLKYCNELLASSQLQRGIVFAQALDQPDALTDNWQELRQQALIDLEEAVTVIKDQPMAYMRIAGLHLLPGGNTERAKEALNLMVQSTKDSPALQFEAVSALTELEPDAEKRESIWADAAKNGYPKTLLFHAFTLFELKRNEEAGNVLQKLLEAESGNVELHEQVVVLLVELQRFDDALAVVKKLQTLAESPQNYLREILVLNELGKHDDSFGIVQKLKEKYPQNESGWTMVLMEIYIHQKAYDKALALVEEQLKENPAGMRWIVAKTQVFIAQKQWDGAADWLESHIQENSEPEGLTRLLISVLNEQKKYKTAKEKLKPLMEKKSGDVDLLRIDSQLSISLGLHAEAVEALTKVVEADPEDYTSVNNLAWILSTSPVDSLRDGRRAVELAQRAGELTNFKRAFVLSTLAAAYAEAGDFEKAREVSLKSVEVAKAERNKTDEERQELLEHLQKEWDCFEKNLPFRELLEDGVE